MGSVGRAQRVGGWPGLLPLVVLTRWRADRGRVHRTCAVARARPLDPGPERAVRRFPDLRPCRAWWGRRSGPRAAAAPARWPWGHGAPRGGFRDRDPIPRRVVPVLLEARNNRSGMP